MRVTFVYPDFSIYMDGTWSEGRFTLGVACLTAVLHQDGHQVSLVHVFEPQSEEGFVQRLRDTNPDLIAFSSVTLMYPHVKQLAKWAGSHFTVPIIYGGVHPTLDPQGALETEGIDMICVGEGEFPLRELCDCLERGVDYHHIQNLWFKEPDGVHRNSTRPLMDDLSALPIPDRSVFDYEHLDDRAEREGALMASRGCPYNCTYCCNHAFKDRYPNKNRYVRFRSVDHVLAELKQLQRNYPWIDHFYFYDDILNMKRDWFEEFVVRYKREIGLPFRCYGRANLLDERSMRLFAEAGCYLLQIGVESGNPWIRENVLNRQMSNETIIKAFALAREYGIGTTSLNMVGIPFETLPRALDTIKLNGQHLRPTHDMSLAIIYPFPHTQLYELCKEKGFLSERAFTSAFQESVLDLDTISRDEILFLARNYRRLVSLYGRVFDWPDPARKIGEKALDLAVGWPLFRRLYARNTVQDFLPKMATPADEAEAEWRVQILDHETPATMAGERIHTVPITVRNVGRRVLPTPRMSKNAVNLSYHWLDETGQVVVSDGIRSPLPHGLATGQTITLKARVQAPGTAGHYKLVWDLVHEGVAWLSDYGSPTAEAQIRVVQAGPSLATAVGRALAPVAWSVGRAMSIVRRGDGAGLGAYRAVLLKRTPHKKLRAGDRYVMRLALVNSGTQAWLPPEDSAEFVSLGYEWRSPQGVVVADGGGTTFESRVAPSEQVDINIPVETPAQPGEYRLVWRLCLGTNGRQRALPVRLPGDHVAIYA